MLRFGVQHPSSQATLKSPANPPPTSSTPSTILTMPCSSCRCASWQRRRIFQSDLGSHRCAVPSMPAHYLKNATSASKPSMLRTRLGHSPRFCVGHKSDHDIWPDLCEAPDLVGGESRHGVVLGVVEGVVAPRPYGAGREFGEALCEIDVRDSVYSIAARFGYAKAVNSVKNTTQEDPANQRPLARIQQTMLYSSQVCWRTKKLYAELGGSSDLFPHNGEMPSPYL